MMCPGYRIHDASLTYLYLEISCAVQCTRVVIKVAKTNIVLL